MTCFTQEQLQSIADALGDTGDGLTGSEIAHLLESCGIVDVDPTLTKRHRLYNAFAQDQNYKSRRQSVPLNRLGAATFEGGAKVYRSC
jgi:hypothetical protein